MSRIVKFAATQLAISWDIEANIKKCEACLSCKYNRAIFQVTLYNRHQTVILSYR